MDGKDSWMFSINVSEEKHNFQQIWKKNELTVVSLGQTWLEVLAELCPTLPVTGAGGSMPKLRIQLASSLTALSECMISVKRDQLVKCALEFCPSLRVVHFDLIYPESDPNVLPVTDSNKPLRMSTGNGNSALATALDPDNGPDLETMTSESIVRGVTAYTSSKDAEIKKLKAEVAAIKQENLELKSEKMKWFLENKSLKDRNSELEVQMSKMKDQFQPGVESLNREMASVRIEEEHPESCPSTFSSSKPSLETDGQVTDLPNTHLEPPQPAKPLMPVQASTAPSGDKKAVILSEAKAAAEVSQQEALAKVAGGDYSSSVVSSSEKVKEYDFNTEMMMWLSENIPVTEYKPLLRKMGLTDIEIGNAIFDHPNVVEQKYQCLLYWRNTRKKEDTTVPALLKAIREKSLHQLARDFTKAFPEESFPVETKHESKAELKKSFSSDLEKFLSPYVTDFEALKQDLHNGPRMSAEQCLKMGYPSQEGDCRLDTVFEFWSSAYYKSNTSDSDMHKRQMLREVLQKLCGVRNIFKKHVNQGGVIGPDFEDGVKIGSLPYSKIQDMEEMLSYKDVCNWRDLADWLKKRHPRVFEPVNKNKIRQWESDPDPHKCAKNILQIWETTTQATVGTLYRWLVENGRLDIAEVLE